MKIELIHDMNPEQWDEVISQYDSKFLFHYSAYLRFLEEMQYGKLLRFKIVENESVCGYFTAILMKKAFFRILATPLTGWKTEYMGPIVKTGFNTIGFLKAVDDFCHRSGIHQVEIGNPILEPDLMHQQGYLVYKWEVIAIPLTSDKEQMWLNLKNKSRNRIRKALKNNLMVHLMDDFDFVDHYYDQLIEVFARQKRVPYYSKSMVQHLVKNLRPHDLIHTVAIKYQNETIATGLFLHDDQFIYSFGIASKTKYINLCPNDLLYWTAMSLGGQLGLKKFYVGGLYRIPEQGGIFKHKFSGQIEHIYRYTKNYTPLAFIARKSYKFFNSFRQKVKDQILYRRVNR